MSNSNLGKEKRKTHFREACAKALWLKKKKGISKAVRELVKLEPSEWDREWYAMKEGWVGKGHMTYQPISMLLKVKWVLIIIKQGEQP